MELLHFADASIQPRPMGCPVPLTALQLRGWENTIKERAGVSESRMSALSVRVLGPLDGRLLQMSIDSLVQRHESLHTRIVVVDGTPRQHIDTSFQCPFEVVDLSKSTYSDAEREATQLAQEFIDEKIDLSTGPLLAVKLFKLSDHEHIVVAGLDHIVSDATSCMIFSREIWTLYQQAAEERSFSLPRLPFQFADYAVWQQQTYNTWLEKHAPYWRVRLAGAPSVRLPLDYELSTGGLRTNAALHFPLGKSLSAKLHDLARCEGTRPYLIVLAIYSAVISHWCNQRDVVLTFLSHGRRGHPALENMIGLLANHLHFRIELAKEDTFLDLLRRVHREFQSAYQHPDFDRVPDILPDCVTEIGFNWLTTKWTQTAPSSENRPNSTIRLQRFPLRKGWRAKMLVTFFDGPSGIGMTVTYRPDLFAKTSIENFGRKLQLFASQVVAFPSTAVQT